MMKRRTLYYLLTITLCAYVSTSNAQSTDARIGSVNPISEYYEIPLSYADSAIASFGAYIFNHGNGTITNLKTKFTVFHSGVAIYTDSILTDSLQGNSPLIIYGNSAQPFGPKGSYHVEYEVTHDSIDANPTDNFLSTDTTIVGDTIFKRFKGYQLGGAVSLGFGSTGEFGSAFFNTKTDTLTSVTVGIVNGSGQMTNQPLSVNIREFNNGLPGQIFASSDTIIYSATGGSFVNLTFKNSGNFVLTPADTFVITVVEGVSELTLGSDFLAFTSGTQWVTSPSVTGNQWQNIETFGFNFWVGFMIQANFGNQASVITSMEDSDITYAKLAVFPNPSNGKINIRFFNDERNREVKLQLFNMRGKLMLEKTLRGEYLIQEELNLGQFKKGNYLLKLGEKESYSIQKIILR